MEKRFDVISGKTQEDKDVLAEHLEAAAKEMSLVPGEVEKTEKDIRFLERCKDFFREGLKTLGVEKSSEFDVGQVHFLHEKEYRDIASRTNKDPVDGITGLCASIGKAIFVNIDASEGPWETYRVAAHELVHLMGFSHIGVSQSGQESSRGVYRGGYHMAKKNIEEGWSHDRLRALDEAIVESITRDTLSRHREELVRDFGFPDDENASIFVYGGERRILDVILERIAAHQNKNIEEVRRVFYKGYFDGGKMHLRDIEKAFGKGALSILADIAPGYVEDEHAGAKEEFFLTTNEKRREELRVQLLAEGGVSSEENGSEKKSE